MLVQRIAEAEEAIRMMTQASRVGFFRYFAFHNSEFHQTHLHHPEFYCPKCYLLNQESFFFNIWNRSFYWSLFVRFFFIEDIRKLLYPILQRLCVNRGEGFSSTVLIHASKMWSYVCCCYWCSLSICFSLMLFQTRWLWRLLASSSHLPFFASHFRCCINKFRVKGWYRSC